MKKQFQSLTEKGRWLIATLTLLFTLGVGQMWADELCSATLTGITASSNTTGISQTGCTMKWSGLAVSGSDVVTIGTSTYHKFSGSGSYVQLVLSSGSFQANDIVTVRIAGKDSGKKTVKFSLKSDSGNSASGSASKTATDDVSYTLTADDIETDGSIKIFRAGTSNSRYGSFSVTRSSGGGGGGDPVDPEFTYTPATYVIGDPALDLSTKLSSTNTTGAITFAIKDAAGTGASIANSKNFTATTAGTAKVTVSQEASTGYNAKSQDIDVTVAAPDPCNKYFYFTKAADATTAGVTNNEGGFFTVSASGSNGTSGSIILDGKTYNCTNRTSNVSAGNSLATFTIPANKKGDLYGLLMSSGDGARGLLLDGVSTGVSCEGGTSALHNIVISNITSGTHTLTADGNARVGMFIMKVCDAEYHTITLDLDGGIGATSIQALDGAPATKPADPTKAHCAFAGWVVKSTSAAYDWAANVTGDLTLKATWTQLYTVTFANGGGSGDAPAAVADKAQGETFAVPANTFTAPEGKEFDKWNDGSADYAPGATYTVGTDNVVLTAVWKQLVAKYTVIFKDGDTELGTKLFDVASNPSDADINKTKPLFTFAAWQKDEADIALDAAFWATVAKDATVTLTARWAKAYATSYDMEAYAVSDGASKSGLETALTAAGYAYTNINGIDNGHTHNYTYDGMKYKTNDGDLSFNVVAGKVVEVKTGHLPTNDAVTMYINGVADATVFEGADENIETHKTNYFYSAAEALYRLDVKASKGTCAVKAVTIRDPYQVTFNVDGGDPVSAQYGHPSITLPSASKGTDSFLGWFIGEDKIGEAGDSYTPTANVELVAHWETVSTDARLSAITFSSDAGTLSPAFDPEVVNYTYTMPYPTAAIPAITGATSVNANAQDPIIGEAATAWGGSQTIKGVAQSGDKKTYTITMLQAPKDGVCLVWADATGSNAMTVDAGKSLFAATAAASNTKNTATYGGKTGYKFNSRPANMSVTLSEETFQENDVVEVFVTQLEGADKLRVFTSNDDAAMLKEEGNALQLGVNKLTLPMTSTASLYLRRSAEGGTYAGWNPYVAYIAVYRAMNPMLTAMTIDGRTVTINEDAKTATVTIPYEAELANLTIAKTIVWNAPATENSIVVNGGSAWVIGENTYKLTDKDGDATTYTITVARDVLKHTVSFNTHGGSAVASVEVEHNANLTAVPNDPSKEDYIFQYWSLTDGGEEVDVTTVQINEDKEFHAVWAAETGVVKLLDGEGHVNHTDFITALTEGTVNFDDADHNCVTFGSTTSTVVGQTGANKFIVYNAKTNQTKIKFVLYNTNSNAQKIVLQKIAEGDAAPTDVEIEVPSKERFETSYYTYNSDANRTMYVFTKNTNIKVLQVKVVDDGTPVKQAGEVGYALKLNVGRVFAPSGSAVVYDGLTMNASSNYKVLNSEVLQTQQNISFTVASPVLMTLVSTGAKYQVSTNAAGSGDEYAAGTNEHNLTAGTWYIVSSTGSNMKFTNISFAMPKAAKPVVADLANVDYCQGSAIDELAVSATVSDGGTMLYQWYKDGEIIAGAEAETYQPTADGEYYVEVVNTKAGYQNSDAVQSNTITVTGYAATVLSGTTGAENWPGTDVTISVTASGKNLHYAWYTCDDAMGTNPVAVDPAVDAAELNVTIAAADTYYKVVVSGDCGDAQEAVITVVARQTVELQDVTGNMTWDFSKANDGSAATDNLCNDEVLANVHGIVNNSDFTSDNIKATAKKFKSGKLQASMIKFHTTVDGMITVVFSNTGNKSQDRYLTVNGRKTDKGSKNETAVTYTGFVYAGDVELGVVEGDGNMLNFTSVQFTATTSYTRPVNPSFLGTLCWTNNAVLGGATLYVFAGKNENNYLVFDEVEENRLEAGKPYIFMPENGNTEIKLYNTDNEAALTEDQAPVNNMYGTITGKTLIPGVDDNMYYFSSNHIWAVKDFAVNIPVPAYYCYVDYAAVLAAEPAPAPAPGRRRVTMGVKGEQVATGIGEVQGDKVQSTKVLIDGHIYILRGEKLYDATGRLVK